MFVLKLSGIQNIFNTICQVELTKQLSNCTVLTKNIPYSRILLSEAALINLPHCYLKGGGSLANFQNLS